MLVADSLQPTWTREPLLLRHWCRARPIQTMRETYSLLPCWAIFDMREIRRPCTCFCGWFSILPYSNVEKKKINQFDNLTDFHTLFSHLHSFYHIRIIRICRLRQCRHNTPVQTWVPKSVVPWTASQLLTRTLNYDHDVETYRWNQIHRHARGWLSTADVDQRTPLASSLMQSTTNSNNARNVFSSSLLSNLRHAWNPQTLYVFLRMIFNSSIQ